MVDPNAIEEEAAALGGLTLPQLRKRWEALFGSAPPKSLRKPFLVKACAYQIQVRAHGGLSGRTRRRLRKIAGDVSASRPLGLAPTRRIKPGTRLVRAWGGQVHTVTVIPGGFEYAGERYSSLSAIARAITGTSWNGPAFFGLKGPVTGAQGADNAGTRAQGDGDGGLAASTGRGGAGAAATELEVTEHE